VPTLVGCVKAMLIESGCVSEWNIAMPVLDSLCLSIPAHYYANPYHNFYHAVTVLQGTYCQLYAMKASNYMSTEDMFVLLWASLLHDIKHPGVNNNHMILIGSPVAKL